MSKKAMKQALEALTFSQSDSIEVEELIDDAIKALEEALKQEQGEPVAYLNPDDLCADTAFRWCKIDEFTQPVYTKPQPSQKQEQDEPVAYCEIHHLTEPCVQCEKEHEGYNTHSQPKQEQGEIERLTAALKKANEQTEHFEREWYLRGDELEKLKQKHGEPVGWFKYDKVSGCWHPQYEEYAPTHAAREGWKPLYTKPSQKPWVGLTDEEKYDITSNLIKGWVVEALVRAIEAKLKEKNT